MNCQDAIETCHRGDTKVNPIGQSVFSKTDTEGSRAKLPVYATDMLVVWLSSIAQAAESARPSLPVLL